MTVGTTASARIRRVRCAAVLRSALWCVIGAMSGHGRSFAAAEVDPLVELRRLSTDGHADRALSRLPGLIAAHPDDPRLPFERALLLSSQGRVAESIAVYERMVKTWPELPEPLNNLGVLYAATGDLDRARAAFESALNTQQTARVAYANLGDVNMRLAGRAYARALRIEDGPKVLALAPIRRLPEVTWSAPANGPASAPANGPASATEAAPTPLPGPPPQQLAALSGRHDSSPAVPTVVAPKVAELQKPLPAPVPAPAPAPAPAPVPVPVPVPVPARVPVPVPAPAPAPAPAPEPAPVLAPAPESLKSASGAGTTAPLPPSVASASVPAASNGKPIAAPETGPARDIQAAIAAWASAWSQKSVDAYFAAYVPGYRGSETSAGAWQAARRIRILGKSRIAVGVSRVAIVVAKDGSVAASFRQTYVADQLNVSSSKTLEFVRQGGKWLIRRELAGS